MKKLLKYYRSRTLVFVGYDFFSNSGAWRSIYRVFRHKEANGEAVMLINRFNQKTFRQMVAALCLSPRILINGLGAFMRWEGIVACLLRKDILIYLHDTEYMIDAFARDFPWKFLLFRLIIRRNPVLCVSRQMQEYYRTELGARQVHVIREALAISAKPNFEAGYCHIVMVGSMDERKGVKFFSAVAEEASAQRLPWKFHWVGGVASQTLGLLAERVRWWGWQEAPYEFVSKADLFFLSSLDDPLPLACLEAMAQGKRCVVYRKTGIAEMITGIRGCAVYDDYSVASAIHAINQVIEQLPDSEALIRITNKHASVSAWDSKIQQIIRS
ncbi:MAG: glycosyltransferase [Chthoniobacteraceae bacterium]